jgi:ubiquitin-like modifier-activating enzyme ATG7
MAAALAVELMVALLHSPHKHRHPAPPTAAAAAAAAATATAPEEDSPGDSPIPHQIRGSVATFTQYCPVTPAFAHCTACSPAVVHAYRRGGPAFVRRVCEDDGPVYLEALSGLAALKTAAEAADADGGDDDDF